MGAIFKPEPLSYEDIDGGQGEIRLEQMREFVQDICYPDEPVIYPDDEELPMELVYFAEELERLDGWPSYGKKSDAFKMSAVLSLIDGVYYNSWARDKIAEKLAKSATKPDLVEIMTRVAMPALRRAFGRGRNVRLPGTETGAPGGGGSPAAYAAGCHLPGG